MVNSVAFCHTNLFKLPVVALVVLSFFFLFFISFAPVESSIDKPARLSIHSGSHSITLSSQGAAAVLAASASTPSRPYSISIVPHKLTNSKVTTVPTHFTSSSYTDISIFKNSNIARTIMSATNGTFIPRLLYGTAWKKERTRELVRTAIMRGFRAIDTACQPKHYHEAGVGTNDI
jgi:hypothetical protein